MSSNNIQNEIYQQIQTLKAKKKLLNQEIIKLQESLNEQQLLVYDKISQINYDYANKFFKENNNKITFLDRYQLSISSIQNEIKKLEANIDIRIGDNEDIESSFLLLDKKEKQLEDIILEEKKPIEQSILYNISKNEINNNIQKQIDINDKYLDIINKEYNNDDICYYDKRNKFNDIIKDITMKYEDINESKLLELNQLYKNQTILQSDKLSKYQEIIQNDIDSERPTQLSEIDTMFDEILCQFLQDSELTTNQIMEQYEEINPKVEVASRTGDLSWKEDINKQMNIILNNKINQENLNQELNKVLNEHILSYDISHILLQDELQEDYLMIIMDKLKSLSIQASELDLIEIS